jgi:fructokinase
MGDAGLRLKKGAPDPVPAGSIFGAIEAGGTKFVCAIGTAPDALITEDTIPTTRPEETFARVADFFRAATRAYRTIEAIGVAAFGPVEVNRNSPAYGSILATPKPHWSGADFRAALASLGAPVIVDTDVNGAALGEYCLGAGCGVRTLAYVTVGTGVGAGVVTNGAPLGGAGHYEMGHIRPPRDAARDPFAGRCPFHGDCLEGLACGPAIIDRWGASLADLPPSHPAYDLEADYLAHFAATIVLTHRPDRIVFGGGVMKAAGLMERIRVGTKRLLGGYAQSDALAGDLSEFIVPPALGDRAGVVGAMLLAAKSRS